MSCNWRPARKRELFEAWEDLEFRGVKKRLKRFGVMGGGRFGFRLAVVAAGTGGDDEKTSGVGSRCMLRVVHGDDIFYSHNVKAINNRNVYSSHD